MIIREFVASDIPQFCEIHKKYWNHEFILPDFADKYLFAFTVDDDKGIITIGGVRTIAEAVTVTNKDRSVRDRREALYKILEASRMVTNSFGYDQLHCYVQDPEWVRHLARVGFRDTKGRSLVADVR